MVGLKKHTAIILAIITIMVSYLMLNVGNVQAAPSISASPNPFNQGGSFVLSGMGFPPLQNVELFAYDDTSGACSGSNLSYAIVPVDASGNFQKTFFASIFGVGTHCLQVNELGPPFASIFGSVGVTATPIPEYPLGLPLLAILLVVGYGLVRRRIKNQL